MISLSVELALECLRLATGSELRPLEILPLLLLHKNLS